MHMKYNLDSLGPYAFEEMTQALMKNEFGSLGTVFGIGKDGGREYTYEGEANPSFLEPNLNWKDYWVIQAKFKMPNSKEKNNLKWVKGQFRAEMEKFRDVDKKLRKPDNYIFITNVKLTGQAEVGEMDQFNKFVQGFKKFIPNIHCILYDDLCSMLENNRDVATSYLSFILPGDILNELFKQFQKDEKRLKELIQRYLQKEFKADLFSKLEQSGRKTDENIKIEDVFMDLYTTESNIIDADIYHKQKNQIKHFIDEDGDEILTQNNEPRFVETILNLSNDSQRRSNKHKELGIQRSNKFVLIGSAGQGKSTLTQFISQLYRAFFVNSNSQTVRTPANMNAFLKKVNQRKIKAPSIFRLPFRIILTDYSDWITRQNKDNLPINILSYLKYEIESDGDKIDVDDLRNLFANLSVIIIFDGLDEVPASANRKIIVEEIENFIEIELHQLNSDSIIIITTRPQGFKEEFNNENFTHLKIVELSKEDCLDYLDILLERTITRKVKKEKQFNILKRALENEASARLMRTPLDATIMATLVKRGGNPPEVKYNLYKEYYTTIFDREREKQVFELDKYKIAINSLHEYLGFKLQSISEQKDESARITHGVFKKSIHEYFLKKEFSTLEAKENTEILSNVLTNRLVMITELTIDLENADNNIIGFPVAPIQEYFASLFLINGEEKIIVKRLKKISSNSYWRNVLLFVIGYFQNERRQHLIDNIYTASIQDNVIKDKISKVGSWLAIDILIENIFSEVPKYEKLFARELSEILNLNFSDKLNYILRMPENTINKYLSECIESELGSSKRYIQKIPSWYIAIQIPNLFQEIIEKYWPSEKDEVELLKFIIKKEKLNNKFFIKRALARLNDLLIIDSYIEMDYFLYIISRQTNLDKKQIKQIIEFLFLTKYNFSDNTELIVEIANTKEVTLKKKSYGNIYSNAIDFRISDNYNRELNPFRQDSKENIKLNKIFKEYEIEYIEKLTGFHILPSKITLREYILSLKNVDNKTFKKLKDLHNNWILSYAFENINSKTDINKILKFIDSSDFGEIEHWQNIEDLIFSNSFLKNSKAEDICYRYSSPSMKNERDIIRGYHNFYELIIANNSIKSYPNLQKEFIIQFITSSFNRHNSYSNKDENVDVSKKLKPIINDLIKLIQNYDIEFEKPDNTINIYQLFFNSFYRIIEQADLEELIINNKDKLFSKLHIREDSGDLRVSEPNDPVFELLINIQNFIMISHIECSIVRYVFLAFLSNINEKHLRKININQLSEISYSNDENELSRLFLVLLIKIINHDNLKDVFYQILNKYSSHKYIAKHLVKLLSKDKFPIIHNIEIINKFYDLVIKEEPDNYVLLSEIETLLSNKIESLPSGFNEDRLKKELNLEIK